MEEIRWFPIASCSAWQYTSLYHRGVCSVDGQVITMRFRIDLVNPSRVPDVLGVEFYIRAMTATPDTLEGYTGKLACILGVPVTGRGKTATHGKIVCQFDSARRIA